MAEVTVFTKERMQAIENDAIVGGAIDGNNLVLSRFNGDTLVAGNVRGPIGPMGEVTQAELNAVNASLTSSVNSNNSASIARDNTLTTSVNTAQTRANLGVSKADTAQGTANSANTRSTTNTSNAARCGVYAERTTDQTIVFSGNRLVSFNVQREDTHDFFAPTSSIFTVPSGRQGIYLCTFAITCDTSNNRVIRGYVDGPFTRVWEVEASSDENVHLLTFCTPLDAGATVSVGIWAATGTVVSNAKATIYRVSL